MNKQAELLESQLQTLKAMHGNIKKLPEESMEDVQRTSKEAKTVTERCQQLVTDLAKARQEEQILLKELHD